MAKMTKEEKDYLVLEAYLEMDYYCAVDEARKLFNLEVEAARLKVAWVVDQAGEKVRK